MTYLAYKFRIYPTREQEHQFVKQIGSSRWVWNQMLNINIQSYESDKKFVFYNDMSKLLPSLKKEHEWLKESNSQTLQTILKSLDSALSQSFKSNSNRKGFPQFKSKHSSSQSFTVPQHFKLDKKTFTIPKIGTIRWKQHRKIHGTPKRLTISKDVDQWFVSVMCEVPDSPELQEIANSVGIDLGIKDFAVTSDAEILNTPDYKKLYKKVKKLSKQLSRKTLGSNNRNKQRTKLAKAHRKIRRTRTDSLHKISHSITKVNDLIVFESLNVKGMVKNRKLARAISEQGWSQFKTLTKQKMDRKGGHIVEVGRFYPSTKTCSCCGWIQPMPLSERIYNCGSCGVSIPRDLNAAFNIQKEGLRIIGQGMPELKLVESHGENRNPSGFQILQDSVKQEAQDALASESMSLP